QPLPDSRGRAGLIEGVEVQARGTAAQQAVAKAGHDIQTKRADRRGVVAEPLQLAADPARNLRTAPLPEAHELGKPADRHDAGNDGYGDAGAGTLFDEREVSIRVEEVLGDRRIGTRIDFALEVEQVIMRGARLRVILGIAGHLDVECVTELGAN